MTTNAAIGYGTLFRRGNDDSPETFTPIGEVTDISGPNMKRDAIDATHSQSPNGFREFIGGLRDGGEIQVTMNLVAGAAAGDALKKLFDDFKNDSPIDYQIAFDNTAKTYWQAPMLITDLPPTAPMEGKMTMQVTLKVAGEPTLADGWT